MLISALALASLFFLPMWKITLLAPQYPEGVSMHIYIHKIGGDSPSTLQNINILNHYVGMKFIEPESIPELKYFPFIIMGMIGFAVIAAFVNNKYMFLAWGIVMMLLAIAGLYDFYLWEYDYGHNLSDKAPIKIPGASFQPPVFGTKLILNFTAKSYPHIGGYFATLSIILSVLAWYLKSKLFKHETVIESKYSPDSVLQSVS